MRSYRRLDFLKEKGIDFKYTPFDQGAMVEIFDPKWLGACFNLSNEWMLNKIRADDMRTPVLLEITDPHLPHFVGYTEESKDVSESKIEEHLKKYYADSSENQYTLDRDKQSISTASVKYNLNKSIDNLLDYIASQKFHYGFIDSSLFIFDENRGELPQNFGHRISFVKRDDAISFFDPNYGEITFSHFSDFKIWFREEVKNGALKFFITTDGSEKNYETLADIYPQPHFTKKQVETNSPFSRQIIKRRTQAEISRSNIKEFSIGNYRIHSFHGEQYVKPESLTQENAEQEEKAKLTIESIKKSMLAKSIFGSAAKTSDVRNQLVWEVIRKAEKHKITYRDALIKIEKMNRLKIDDAAKEDVLKVEHKNRK